MLRELNTTELALYRQLAVSEQQLPIKAQQQEIANKKRRSRSKKKSRKPATSNYLSSKLRSMH